ncbi:MAG: cation:dicarboxylase symporter family transporter [Candidatus Kapabacteria bacterium]|nr:cation:dicarboxylase symporter family transporter [Candidatus Kapabacteria bacterium]
MFIGLAVGAFIGWLGWAGYIPKEWAMNLKFLREMFMNLIKSIIAPLVFSSIVAGIAGGGSSKQVGRIGGKAILYFEIVTTLALVVGLLVVNLTHPGAGLTLSGSGDEAKAFAQYHPKTLQEIFVHMFPSSIIKAMVEGDVLQIVMFSVLFGMALSAIGEKAKPVVQWCESLANVMFRFTELVMRFAPFGIGAAMAFTIAHQGPEVLKNLGALVGSLYVALILFVVIVFGAIALLIKLPLKQFFRAVREPFMLAFVTTSSESALPKAMENMERFGVPKKIVGFVMPLGYSFNLDGSTLYLAMASVFLAQAAASTTGNVMPLETQITMMIALMLTSKGIAAVPRASLVVLMATATSFIQPPELVYIGVALIMGVDEFMDMARTSVNLLGNCLATVVIARWEHEFDYAKAHAFGTGRETLIEEMRGEQSYSE